MSKYDSVSAVIPNYNMAESLTELLPSLLDQEYNSVYVLDDASTDHSLEVVNSFAPDVQLVSGEVNLGSGGNRNRIIGKLPTGSIIHFIDADIELDGDDLPERCLDVFDPVDGFTGGLIKDLDGRQMVFNYGPKQNLRNDATVPLHLAVAAIGDSNPYFEKTLRDKFSGLLDRWPNRQKPPARREVFWTTEANLLIAADTFEAVGGYDPNLRDHDIQDLALRLAKLGLNGCYDPEISSTHKAVQVRSGNRNLSYMRAEWYIAKKHGLLNWFLSRELQQY